MGHETWAQLYPSYGGQKCKFLLGTCRPIDRRMRLLYKCFKLFEAQAYIVCFNLLKCINYLAITEVNVILYQKKNDIYKLLLHETNTIVDN